MLIRSKLHRNGGTQVTLGKGKDARHYDFQPLDPKADKDDPSIEHVCDVIDRDDIATFIAIKEGYEIHESVTAKSAPKAAPKAPAAPKATPAQEAVVAAVKGKNYQALKKPDLLKLVAERTGKQPHATASVAKLIETLTKLDAGQ